MKFPKTVNNISDVFSMQSFADGHVDMWLTDHVSGYCKYTTDYYDNSIEIYLAPSQNGILISDVAIEKFKEWGFNQGWVNYTDGTEEHFGCIPEIRRGQIRKASYPRWNEEESREY